MTTDPAQRANIRAIATNDIANRQQQARDRRVDTTTPLGTGAMMRTEELPDLPAEQAQAKAKPCPLILSVTILHRGRMITISSEGRSLDQFCDLLDQRLGVAQ